MARGDVVCVDLPAASQHEQAGTRPAVAVQAKAVGLGLAMARNFFDMALKCRQSVEKKVIALNLSGHAR